MQVALISLADGVAPDEGVHAGLPAAVAADGSLARAYLRIGGLSLAEHQAGWALRAGCRRILLHGSQISGHLLALQQSIEASGAEVRILHHASALAGQIAPDDCLLVIAEGLFASDHAFAAMLRKTGQQMLQPAIAVLPAEPALAEQFERIDINCLWAGVAVLPGSALQDVADLPADWSLASALLRIGSQQRLAQITIPADLVAQGELRLLSGEDDAEALEPLWLDLQLRDGKGATALAPGEMASRWIARRLGLVLLHGGHSAVPLVAGALALSLMGLGAAWLSSPAISMLLLAVAWLLGHSAAMVERLDRGRIRTAPLLSQLSKPKVMTLATDLALITSGTLATDTLTNSAGYAGPAAWISAAFLPMVLVGLLRLASSPRGPAVTSPLARSLLGDRSLLAGGLAVGAILGIMQPLMMAATLGLLGWALWPTPYPDHQE